MTFKQLRSYFPQCEAPGTYLDSAATTLKPWPVIERVGRFFKSEVANVHRGAHRLGDEATAHFEESRALVAKFLNAGSSSEIVFTRGTTEGINLVAASLAQSEFQAGDEIILSQLEHHSNIVPWQLWAERLGLKVKFTKILDNGSLDFAHYESLFTPRTKMVSLTQLSNALGVRVDLAPFIRKAREYGALFLVDAAQSVSAHPVDVQEIDCDFLVFSGHKLFAPTGIGVLYGRKQLLDRMAPYQGGGSMIDRVRESGTTYLPAPQRFEAGTPAIAEAIGLGEAIRFLNQFSWSDIQAHDSVLVKRASDEIRALDFKVFAAESSRSHSVSFGWNGVHPSDISAILNQSGVAVRAGHHCCQPLMDRLGVPGTVRASFSIYSNEEDVDQLVRALKKAKELLL